MNFTHFMRVEREMDGQTKHFVVHTQDPKLAVEIMPDEEASDRRGKGIIKRIRVPNSWAGNYSQYSRIIAAAQEFYQHSLADPVTKNETKRFAR